MFPAWIFLSLNSLFFTLRLSGGVTGSFPRPLKAEEERMYLERMTQGDLEARNILIEHNLRLVALRSSVDTAPLMAAAVPTFINTGVSMVPCTVWNLPLLARPSFFKSSYIFYNPNLCL